MFCTRLGIWKGELKTAKAGRSARCFLLFKRTDLVTYIQYGDYDSTDPEVGIDLDENGLILTVEWNEQGSVRRECANAYDKLWNEWVSTVVEPSSLVCLHIVSLERSAVQHDRLEEMIQNLRRSINTACQCL